MSKVAETFFPSFLCKLKELRLRRWFSFGQYKIFFFLPLQNFGKFDILVNFGSNQYMEGFVFWLTLGGRFVMVLYF